MQGPGVDALRAWASSPVTKYVMDSIKEDMKYITEEDVVDFENIEKTAQKAAYRKGFVEAIKILTEEIDNMKRADDEENVDA